MKIVSFGLLLFKVVKDVPFIGSQLLMQDLYWMVEFLQIEFLVHLFHLEKNRFDYAQQFWRNSCNINLLGTDHSVLVAIQLRK